MQDLALSLHSSQSFKTRSEGDACLSPFRGIQQLFVYFIILYHIPERCIYRPEGWPVEDTLKSCKVGFLGPQPPLPRAPTRFRSILALQRPRSRTLPPSTRPFTPSPSPGVRCRIKSFVSTTINSDTHKMAIWGLRKTFSAPAQACSVAKISIHLPQAGLFPSCLLRGKMEPQSGVVSSFPCELLIGSFTQTQPLQGTNSALHHFPAIL